MIPDADVQASIASFTQDGMGTLRTRPVLPTRPTMTQWSSRRWMRFTFSAATSARRNPQPITFAADRVPRNGLHTPTLPN